MARRGRLTHSIWVFQSATSRHCAAPQIRLSAGLSTEDASQHWCHVDGTQDAHHEEEGAQHGYRRNTSREGF